MAGGVDTRGGGRGHAKDHVHPAPSKRFLVHIGLFLFVITLAEFLITYVHGIPGMITAALFALSILKFALVAWIFMHLKYDNRVLTGVFLFGFVLATLVVITQKYLH